MRSKSSQSSDDEEDQDEEMEFAARIEPVTHLQSPPPQVNVADLRQKIYDAVGGKMPQHLKDSFDAWFVAAGVPAEDRATFLFFFAAQGQFELIYSTVLAEIQEFHAATNRPTAPPAADTDAILEILRNKFGELIHNADFAGVQTLSESEFRNAYVDQDKNVSLLGRLADRQGLTAREKELFVLAQLWKHSGSALGFADHDSGDAFVNGGRTTGNEIQPFVHEAMHLQSSPKFRETFGALFDEALTEMLTQGALSAQNRPVNAAYYLAEVEVAQGYLEAIFAAQGEDAYRAALYAAYFEGDTAKFEAMFKEVCGTDELNKLKERARANQQPPPTESPNNGGKGELTEMVMTS